MTKPQRPRKAKHPTKPAGGTPALSARSNLDLVVLRALILLSTADSLEFADHQWPPREVCQWLEKADLRHVRGMLLATLERWQQIHGHGSGNF